MKILPDKVFSFIKWLVIVFIPATTTLVSVILSVWNLATPETITAIVTTLTAIATFLGALIGVSTLTYHQDKEIMESK